MSAGLALVGQRDEEIDEAIWWRDHAGAHPDSANRKARAWLSTVYTSAEVRVLAWHIACLASLEQGGLNEARQHAKRGLTLARRAGLTDRAAELGLSLAWVEANRGDQASSWRSLLLVESQLRGVHLAGGICLRGWLYCQADRYRDAAAELTRAVRMLRDEREHRWLAEALAARGTARLYLHRLDDAEQDLVAAERLFAARGRTVRAAECRHLQGRVAMRIGDLPRALRCFSEALAGGMDPDVNPEMLVDRAEALATAGLRTEARAAMRHAVRLLASRGRRGRLAETKLALAECALRDGDSLASLRAADEARRMFRQQRRPMWEALATAMRWRAKFEVGRCSRWWLCAAERAAAACLRHGWVGAAAELRLVAGRAADRAGMYGPARKLLGLAAECRKMPNLPSPQRSVGWLAQALLAEMDGDHQAVLDACRGGLRAIDSYAAAMVAFDLRVHAFGLATELSRKAIGTALAIADPRLVLRWTERCKASALNCRVLQPPADQNVRAALMELRAASADVRQGHAPRQTMARVTALEDRVRHRAMVVEGTIRRAGKQCGIDDVLALLGETVLVSFFANGETLYAISVLEGEIRLHRLGKAGLRDSVSRLKYFLARKAGESSLRVRHAYAQGARHTAAAIDHRLLAPLLRGVPADRPLVVVPTGELYTLPWAELPHCQGRPVTVTPSLRSWLHAADEIHYGQREERHVWVAGPGLKHAEQEVRTLHALSGGHLLLGDAATTDRVLSSVDGAETAHIAAHGWFRDDQPQLSCLDLADGPLYGYDFDRLHRAPRTVVLSACEVGQAAVRGGDELSGLAIALLGRGTATVISSVVPVPDQQTAQVMVALYRNLGRGMAPAAALASAQAEHGESGFLCVGYGGS